MRYQAPRGTHDILPKDVGEWRFIEGAFREVCSRYGYLEIRTPEFEVTDLFVRTSGETSDIVTKQMYSFTDPGGDSYTLRPEGTAPVVRAYLEHALHHGMPLVKVCYVCVPIFRYERPQSGRFRQHHQVGIEAIGSQDPALDAEIIALGVDFLKALEIEGYEIHLNSIGCPKCRPTYRDELIFRLRRVRDELCEECKRRLEVNPLRVLDCKNESCCELTQDAPVSLEFLCAECSQHFEQLQKHLRMLGIDYVIDKRLVRGLDYYTKTAFEFLHGELGAQNAILGGGRYDGLVEECGGAPTPGIGFGCGVERLIIVRQQQGKKVSTESSVDVFIVTVGEGTKEAALKLLYEIRRAGISADTDYFERSLKAKMRFADKLDAKFVVIVGKDEIARGKVTVREMERSEQKEVPIHELAGWLVGCLAIKKVAGQNPGKSAAVQPNPSQSRQTEVRF